MNALPGAVIIFFVSLFVFLKASGPIPLSIQSVTTAKTDSFTVSGTGMVETPPDIASVTAGVTSQGSTVKQAQDDLNRKMNAITDSVKSLGIKKEDIKTSRYAVSPQYDYRSPTQRITGYTASSTIAVKVRNLDLTNSVIDQATKNGANEIHGISFEVDDPTKAEQEAREKAIKEAKTKAQLAAKSAGFKLGRVINYSENTGGDMPRPMFAKMDIAAGAPESASTNVEPGSNEITVTVSLSYEVQ